MVKLNAKQLRQRGAGSAHGSQGKREGELRIAKNDIYIILEDVLDTYNIGAIFRLADAVAAKKIYLCGGTETPPNPRIKKSSINTTELVDWEYCETAEKAIEKLRKFPTTVEQEHFSSSSEIPAKLDESRSTDIQIIAVEQAEDSVPYTEFDFHMPLALLVGNESYGVLPSTLKKVDAVVELPMFGVNMSLNVMVSLGIVLYKALEKIDT